MPQEAPFAVLRSHTGNPLFWSDLASCHYSGTTLNWLREHIVDFVEKHCYPLNCPELRPIERYWAIVKVKLRINVKEAKNKALKINGLELPRKSSRRPYKS